MREKGAGGCHFYEMIFAKDPCWAYFDLEFSRTDAAPAALDAPSPPPALNADVNGDVMTSIVYRAAKELIEARWRAQDAPPPSKSLFFQSVALDSHRPDKFSRHLLIKVYIHDTASEEPKTRPLPLISNSHAGSLAKAIVAKAGDKLKVQKKPPSESAAPEFTSFVDTAVYSTSRAFRTIGSSKEGKPEVLEIHPGYTTATLAAGDHASRLRFTLVCPPAEELKTWSGDLLQFPPHGAAPAAAKHAAPPARRRRRPAARRRRRRPPRHRRRRRRKRATRARAAVLGGEDHAAAARLPGHAPRPSVRRRVHQGLRPAAGALRRPWPTTRWRRCARGAAATRTPKSRRGATCGRRGAAARTGECLLHLTDSKKGGYCAHRKCEHKSQKAIVTLDLMSGRAWHRCWDDDCVVGGPGGPKAKHELPRPPAAAVPPLEELLDFELRQGLRGPRGGGDEDGGDDPPTQE